MTGINVEKLDNLIKKHNYLSDSFNKDINKLKNELISLNSCYSGKDLEFLFMWPVNEIRNLATIQKVIESYSNVLLSAKNGYQKQDLNIKSQIDHINSNFN